MSDETNQYAQEATRAAGEQFRQLGDQATGTGRAFGHLMVDSYEQALHTYVEIERKAAQAVPVEWIGTALSAQASFVENLGTAYVKAARSVLS
jgi:hypothetical protein